MFWWISVCGSNENVTPWKRSDNYCIINCLWHFLAFISVNPDFQENLYYFIPNRISPIPIAKLYNSETTKFCFFFLFLFFFYSWLYWVFVSPRGLSPVVASGGHSSSRCAGLSLSRPLLLRSTGSRHAGSVVVAHGRSCSAACGIFPDQGSNPCPLHWQADSQLPRHQGSPRNHQVFYQKCE